MMVTIDKFVKKRHLFLSTFAWFIAAASLFSLGCSHAASHFEQLSSEVMTHIGEFCSGNHRQCKELGLASQTTYYNMLYHRRKEKLQNIIDEKCKPSMLNWCDLSKVLVDHDLWIPDFDGIVIPQHVKVLRLNDNMLVTSQLKGLKLPDNLRELDLRDNRLESLDGSFKLPESLEGLYLSYNKLVSLNGLKLPDKLSTLTLNCNLLESLDESFKLPESLEGLYLSYNNLVSLNGLKLPDKLSELSLDHNELESLDESFKLPDNLRKLRLNSNRLESLDESFKLPESLEILDLSYNNLVSLNGLKLPDNLEKLVLTAYGIQKGVSLDGLKRHNNTRIYQSL